MMRLPDGNPKIAFITTVGVNVGDEFIREGICSFFDELFDAWTPYYVNKHDLATLYRTVYDEPGRLGDKIRDADIVVQAGAPVYWKIGSSTSYNVEWADELWFKRVFRLGPDKPILNIAAGACQPYPDFAATFLADPACVDFALRAARACRWTSVRDPLASQILYALNVEHEPLACSAFHAARRLRPCEPDKDLVGVNLMPLGGHYRLRDDVREDAWLAVARTVLREIRRHHRVRFIAHDGPEERFMAGLVEAGEEVFHSADYRDYLTAYQRCSYVLANRVHGGVCAAGFGRPAIIVGNDTRLQIADFIGLPGYYVGTVSSEELCAAFRRAVATREQEEERLLALREESALRYRSAMAQALGSGNPPPLRRATAAAGRQPVAGSPGPATPEETDSRRRADFLDTLRRFAGRYGFDPLAAPGELRGAPWVWFNVLAGTDFSRLRLLHLGGSACPFPWFLASIGADVTLGDSDPQSLPRWEKLRAETGLGAKLKIVPDERLPFEARTFDIVTSFCVLERSADRPLAVAEVCRVLKPGGRFALAFALRGPSREEALPDEGGRALTGAEFEEAVGNAAGLVPVGTAHGKAGAVPHFVACQEGAAGHGVGAALLRKRIVDGDSVKRVLLPRLDTHGDIVLFKGFVDALLERFPKAEVTLLVREGYDQLKPLFSERLAWRTLPCDPWARYSDAELQGMAGVLGGVAAEPWDLVLFTTYHRTFPEEILAALLAEPVCVGLGRPPALQKWQERALARLKLTADNPFDQILAVDELTHETEKYQRLWDLLFDDNAVVPPPRIAVPGELRTAAESVLESLGLQPGSYVVCMPAGVQNVRIKKWPEERFAEVLCWLARERGLAPLLIGHESERGILEKVESLAETRGTDVKSWLGGHGDLALLAALAAGSALYVGNDSAPMHLAAATGIPTVGIYGGGTWPRFTPVGARSLAAVAPLPCFYCGWECVFGEAHCLRLVTVDDVQAAIDRILSREVGRDRTHRAAVLPSADSQELMEQSSRVYRGLRSVLRERDEARDALSIDLEDCAVGASQARAALDALRHSLIWRAASPLRRVLDKLRNPRGPA